MSPPRSWSAPLALFGLVVLAWLPALAGGYVWDDLNNIVLSDRLRGWGALLQVFRHPAMWSAGIEEGSVGTYRPLALASLVLDHQVFGLRPWGYHLTSVLLHGGASVALLQLLRRWLPAERAFGLALLWAMHPICVEAVAWINGRSEPLALLFGASAAALASTPRPGRGRLAAIGALLCLALLGKETGGVFALLAPALAWEAARAESSPRRPWPVLAVAAGSVLAYSVLRAGALGSSLAGTISAGLTGAWVLGAVWGTALGAVILPLDRALMSLHPWLASLCTAEVVGYWGAILAGSGLTLRLWWRGRRVAALGLLWWGATLTPVVLIALQRWPGFYRWLYLGLPGLLLALGRLLPPLGRRRGVALLALAGVPLLVQTQRAIPVWRSNPELFATMIDEHPDDPFGYLNLAEELVEIGRYPEAESALRRALDLGAVRPEAHLLLGRVLALQGQCLAAVAEVRAWAPLDRIDPRFFLAAGTCFAARGEHEKARRLLARCVGLPGCEPQR